MAKEITAHHDGHGLTESIFVKAVDEVGPGGAHHIYKMGVEADGVIWGDVARIQFQKGPRNEPGSTPGVVELAVLAVVYDRLVDFQAGPFACEENAYALSSVVAAMRWMKKRADNRAARGVLGKNEK